MSSTLLITGASGFIGSHLIPLLKRIPFSVHAISRRPQHHAKIDWHECDLFDAEAVSHLIHQIRPSHLLHLAWDVTPGQFWNSPQNAAWKKQSLSLLNEFILAGGKRVVMAGTCAEYAADTFLQTEQSRLSPTTEYGRAKLQLFAEAQSLAAQKSVSFAWGRIFYPYGPLEPEGRLLPSLVTQLLKDKAVPCTTGQQIRDFIFVKDVAQIFTNLIVSSIEGAVNVGTGKGTTVEYFANKVANVLNKTSLLKMGELPDRPNEPSSLVADISYLKQIYSPPFTSLEEGIRQSIEYWKTKHS